MRNPPTISTLRGFTLVEVVIVGVLLVLLATMVVPRLSGMTQRRQDAAIDAAASVVAAFAFHESTGTRQLALSYDEDYRQLELQILDVTGDDPNGRAEWRVHPNSQPVTLPEMVEIASVSSDGEALDPDKFFIASTSAGDRPSIMLRLNGDANTGATIVLTPYALAPKVTFDRDNAVTPPHERANLNDMGLEREDW